MTFIVQPMSPKRNHLMLPASSRAMMTRTMRMLAVAALTLSVPAVVIAQRPSSATAARDQAEIVFQLHEEVEVSSAIIRVSDVLRPVGRKPADWDALAGAALGLLPPDGRRLRMERQRISETLQRSGLLKQPVRWSGPAQVAIRYVASPRPLSPRISPAQHTPPPNQTLTSNHEVRPASYAAMRPDSMAAGVSDGVSGPAQDSLLAARQIDNASSAGQAAPTMLPVEFNRVRRLVLSAFQQSHEDVLKAYEVELVATDAGIHDLAGLRSVASLRLGATPAEGQIPLIVSGNQELESVQGTVLLELIKLPTAVVAVQSLKRGDILTARDLLTTTIPSHQANDRHVTELKSLIGKQLTRSISRDRPILQEDVSEPIVIDRGDLVELRVLGAGIKITTTAKALGPATAGEMIQVETMSPKRQLVARAVSHGVVEIVTRPPQIRN